MPSSSIPVPERDAGTSPSPRKSSNAEDLRRHNAKLRSDLEAERAKVRQVLRDKSAEVKRIQENFDKDKQKAVELATKRLVNEHAVEIKKVRENTSKEKDNELRQVLKFKEEEVKTLKQQVQEEKEKNRSAEEELRRILADKGKEGEDRSEIERKLRSEITTLKEQKHRADEMYRIKVADDNEKAEIIRRLKAEHEIELQKFMKDSKRESIHTLQQRRLTEKALEEKAHELAFKDHLAKKLEAEKDDLQRRLSRSGDVESLRRSSVPRMGASLDLGSNDRLDESPLAKKDKERELIKKNAELLSKVENLEKKCAVLEKEASKSGNVKAKFVAEEKIKKLKKRNSELVSIARQLEDKAKKLQEEKVKAQKLAEENNNSNNNNNAGVDHVKKVYARQRAKDLAEHAKSVMSKEKELEDLKKQLLLQRSGQHLPKEKVEELQSIIRQSAKERLWLEKQLSNTDSSRAPSPLLSSGDFAAEIRKKTDRLDAVEAENKKLRASVDQLQKAEAESAKLARELKEKDKENHKLVNELEDKQTRCSKLEHERERFAAKCTMLQKKNGEMGKRIEELEEVEDQVSNLKEKLEVSNMKCSLLTEECNKMKTQLEELLKVKEDLKKMEQQKTTIEKEHLSSLEKLKEREEEIRQLHKIQEEANKAHEMAVTSLEDAVRSLEQKCTDAEENNVNLKKQVEELRLLEKEYVKKSKEGCHKYTQTTFDSPQIRSDVTAINAHPLREDFNSQSRKLSPGRPSNETPAKPSAHISPTTSPVQESKTDPPRTSPAKRSAETSEASASRSEKEPSASDDILDVLHSRIDQLAASDSEDDLLGERAHREEESDVEKRKEEEDEEKSQRPDLDLDDLAKRINQVALSDDTSSVSTRDRDDSDASQDLTSMAEGDLGDMEDNQPDSSAPEDDQMENSTHNVIGKLNVRKKEPTNNELQTSEVADDELSSKAEALDSQHVGADLNDVDPAIKEKLAVYIARYSYDPVQHSPNENPEMELAFQAGDYLYVFGEMDEDGYFLSELMSGQRGLVPSNFVEKVADESEMSMMMNGTGDRIDEIIDSSDEEDAEGKLHRALRLSVEHIPDVGLGDIQEEDENEIEEDIESGNELDEEDAPKRVTLNQDGVISDETDSDAVRVPSPRRLFLERQFTRSVLLSWKPADLPPEEVSGYGVYVNGDLRLTVKGGNKTKALLEDIDPEETYRISVRTITANGEESSDRSAVVTIGKDANLAPSHVHVTCVSPTSAKVEWSPGNSSFSHEILVNGALHRTVRPGIFQHTISNLEPDHMYKVHVRAKNSKQVVDHENEADIVVDFLTAETEFRTEPGGLPDPPLDVKASLGHANSLDVNWIPVTITEKGTSNGARVTGYKVYINGFPCTEVTSPTAGYVSAVSWMVERAIKRSHSEMLRVVVRTQSCEWESADSNEVELPAEMFNFKVTQFIKPKTSESIAKTADLVSQNSVEDKDHRPLNESDSVSGASANVEQRERSDSVKRYSRDESGQPVLVLVNGSHKEGVDDSTPLVQPRTKGEPVVWKNEEADESETVDSTSKSDERESENEDEEQLEICIPEVMDDHVTPTEKQTEQKEPEVNAVQQGEHLDEANEEKEEIEDVDSDKEVEVPEDELHFGDDDVLPIEEETSVLPLERPQITKKESDLSVASDIDVEELGRSLDAAQSIPRESHDGREVQAKIPYIRPLEYEESDFESESSEQEPLSIIQEEDEEDLSESVALPSNFSESHSASEGFQSDDDVIDLLDDDGCQGQSAAQGIDIRKISQSERPEALSPGDTASGGLGFGKYLTSSSEDLKMDASQNSPYRLLDSIELEDSEVGVVEVDGIEATYSDTEADRDGLERTSTPLDEHEQPNLDYQGAEQDEASPEDVSLEEEQAPSGEGPEDGAAQEEQVRVFLALYDYDPATMSPNPDAEEEELTFNEGDLIKVYGDRDEDGFYWGELDGRAGYIPFNMVSEVPLEDCDAGSNVTSPSLDITQDSIQTPEQRPSHEPEVDTNTSVNALDEVILEEGEFEDPRKSHNYQLAPRRMVALFDYDPRTLSPNPDSDVELKFKVGDVIYVYGDMDEDGFFTGELRGIRGLVPSNFLEDLSDPAEAQQDSSHEDSYESPLVSAEKYSNLNGTYRVAEEDTPKKKKGIFSKGKQMFKKIAKSHHSQNSKR